MSTTCARKPRGTLGGARTNGFTLIEVLVSMVISLFLVIGAMTVFVNSRKSGDVDESIARLQESARYAMSVIEDDVRMANYWGLDKNSAGIVNKPSQTTASTPSTTMIASIPSALACGATYAINVETFIEANNNAYALPATTCGAFNSSASASADTLTVRRAGTSGTSAISASKLQLCANRSSTQIMLGGTCAAPAEVHDLIVHAYYIANQSSSGTTVPSLRRKSLGVTSAGVGPAFNDEEVIPGVEDMQVQLGWDSGTSGSAVRYVNPGDAILATGQIVAVRVWLLVRTETSDFAYKDARPAPYTYGDRLVATGTVSSVNATGAAGSAYLPSDGFRRLLVSRTFFIRNAVGT